MKESLKVTKKYRKKLLDINESLAQSLNLLTANEKKKTLLIVLIQTLLGILDLIGVALIGILAALTISGIESQKPGNRVSRFLEITNLDSYTFQFQALMLAILATILFVSRTIISVYFTRRILHFLSRRGAEISATAMEKHISRSLQEINTRTVQETIYLLTVGIIVVTLGILGTLMILATDLILLLVMMFGLFIVNPIIALISLSLFSIIGVALYFLLGKRAKELGELNAHLSVSNSLEIQNSILSYREMYVKSRRKYFIDNFKGTRFALANVLAEVQFLPNISKYVIESSVIVTSTVICAVQFLISDSHNAIATLSVFLAAGSRITPALMRMQQGAIQLKGSLATAAPTLIFLKELEGIESAQVVSRDLDIKHLGFSANVSISNVDFKYPGSNEVLIEDFSLEIRAGDKVALVGTSGVGKSTLMDLILGILKPDSGEIMISGMQPHEAISRWPGALSYVPQDIYIIAGTVRENIVLGYSRTEIGDAAIESAVVKSQLSDYVQSLNHGIDSELQENGRDLSGGQKQRIGIARALITNPQLLLLDEATSSLDGQTELSLSDSISGLENHVTVIAIAHRLSTIMHYNKIVFLVGGGRYLVGTFNELRNASAEFDSQAKLMGL